MQVPPSSVSLNTDVARGRREAAHVSCLEQQLVVLALYELPPSLDRSRPPQSEGNGGLHTPRKEAKGTYT